MPAQKRASPTPRPSREKASTAATPKSPRARKPAVARSAAARGAAPTPLSEWIAAAVGLILVLATIGVIGREALSPSPSPPAVKVEVLEIRPAPTGFLARIRAENVGDKPAVGVEVEGQLETSEAEPETATATFDYLAAGSSREGGLFFQADPRSGALTVAAKGFVEP